MRAQNGIGAVPSSSHFLSYDADDAAVRKKRKASAAAAGPSADAACGNNDNDNDSDGDFDDGGGAEKGRKAGAMAKGKGRVAVVVMQDDGPSKGGSIKGGKKSGQGKEDDKGKKSKK
jgi:hypothetical protein